MNNRFPNDEDSEDRISLEKEMEISNEDLDSLYQDEVRGMERDSDIHRLSHRITILSILIPVLLCAIFVFAYLDMKERVSQIQTKGSQDVQVLSQDVVAKMTSLTDNYTKIEKSLADRLLALEKTSASMEKRLKDSQREIKNLTTSKVDNKTFEQTEKRRSEEVSSVFSAFQKDIAQQKESFGVFAKDLNAKIDQTTDAITAFRKEIAEVLQIVEATRQEDKKQASLIGYLSEQKLDREEFDSLLDKKLADYKEILTLLEKEIRSLKGEIPRAGQQINSGSQKNLERATQSPQPEGKHGGRTTTGTPAPEPEKIIEQDIAE